MIPEICPKCSDDLVPHINGKDYVCTSEDCDYIGDGTYEPDDENEPPMCSWCNGTGENRWGTGSCRDCGGSGVEKPKKQQDY